MRSYVSHLDSNTIEWEEILKTGAFRKIFNTDPESGSDTSLVRLPPGWQGPAGAHYHSDFEEALVLSGDVDLNGDDSLVSGSYLYRPGGIVHGFVDRSVNGSNIIIKMGASTDLVSIKDPLHEHEYAHPDAVLEDGRDHIVHLRTESQEWFPWSEGDGNVSYKQLSYDKQTGAQTLLLSLTKDYSGSLSFSDDHSWEWVVLSGDFILNDGVRFEEFCYSFRPRGCGNFSIEGSNTGSKMILWKD